MKTSKLIALGAALVIGMHGSASAADVAAGEKVYKKCVACHSLEPGKKKTGPSLHGVVGRKAGSEDYKYLGLKDADFSWDEKNLDAYLANPKKFVTENTDNKRSKMAFKLNKEQDRANVIAYLKTIK